MSFNTKCSDIWTTNPPFITRLFQPSIWQMIATHGFYCNFSSLPIVTSNAVAKLHFLRFVAIVILNLFWILLGVLSALDDTYIAMGNDHFVDDLPVYPSNIATFHSYVNYQGVNPILFPSIADCTLMFDGQSSYSHFYGNENNKFTISKSRFCWFFSFHGDGMPRFPQEFERLFGAQTDFDREMLRNVFESVDQNQVRLEIFTRNGELNWSIGCENGGCHNIHGWQF